MNYHCVGIITSGYLSCPNCNNQIPFEIEGIMIDLWEIDLSPGILTIPLIPFDIFELINIYN